jgi:hypothetical protein
MTNRGIDLRLRTEDYKLRTKKQNPTRSKSCGV